MSVQFGKCNFDDRPVDPHDLDEVRPVLAQYGPDGEGYICKDSLGILYRALHTTKESRRETQPHVSKSGAVISWDGRLDNREDLIERLVGELSPASTDVEIVAAAHERWGTDAFRELIGDWALSIWNVKDRSLVLARDFAGTRQLYYSVEKDQVAWCTILDPLVLFADHSLELDEEYIAGWLSFFPATHLTPYVGIHAVPPSSFVRLTRGTQRVSKYWDFDPAKRIRYPADSEYEEHFRIVFSESVRRRLRSDSPVLAELSGGMDSSSIVCMADSIASGRSVNLRVDTISYYDDSEPNWDERPYFTKVEQKRGRTGLHIDVSCPSQPSPGLDSPHFVATPSSVRRSSQAAKTFSECMTLRGYRVLLSGVGGDEVTGGVPTPIPEIQDLIATARLRSLARQLKSWALTQRRPWIHLLFDALRGFVPEVLVGIPKHKQPAAWLHPEFVKRNGTALRGYDNRRRLFGALPSVQDNLSTLDGLRRQLSCSALASEPPCDVRYPYLDRSLLEFLYGVPRHQIVRPGHRRSLMRRALIGIVPDEILNRKRKAFVTRSAAAAVSHDWDSLADANSLATEDLGIVDGTHFREALQQLRAGHELPVVTLLRTLACESWIRSVKDHLTGPGARQQLTTELGACPTGERGRDCLPQANSAS
jgi:asparagine synthase (glutamine-hydrolysing)